MGVLSELRIEDYPQRARAQTPAMTLTERQAPAPPALPEGSYEVPYQLDYYEDGYPELPARLDRRHKPTLAEAA
jgi:hypothetical protein